MLEQYYLTIRKQLANATEGEETEVTLPQLTGWLHFSSRNVNLVLKKMEELSWIRWLPGRGRGHRSKIVFGATREAVAMKLAKEYVDKGDLQTAFAWIDEHAYLPALREQFVHWLDSHFGYRPGENDEETKDTLRIPYDKPIQSLDPPHITYVAESHLAKHIFDGLVRYNKTAKTIEPHLAHCWRHNEAGTDWIFYLRKGVLFHHGREMTAHDVKFSLDRVCHDLDSHYRWMFEDVERIEVVGKYAVRILLARSNSLFLRCLSFDRASIVPEDVVLSAGESFKRHPVGTGPFQVVHHDNNMLVCEAFARYFDKRAHLDRIEIWYTPKELNCLTSCAERTIHRIRTPGADGVPDQANNIEIVTNGGCIMLTFNMRMEGPTQRLSFRQAVIHGIDRKSPELLPSPGEALFAEWFVPEGVQTFGQEKLYDPERAKRLLEESGYNGETLLLAVSEGNVKEGEAYQRLLGELGIHVQLEIVEYDLEQRLEAVKRCHMSLYSIILDDDVLVSILEVFLAGNSFVYHHLSDAFIERLKPLIRQIYNLEPTESASGRPNEIGRIERLAKEHAAVFFLHHWQQKTIYHPSLKGVSFNALGWVPFGEVWFEPMVKEPLQQ